MNTKLQQAYHRGVMSERARILWLMDDERHHMRRSLENVILVEAQRHAMQVKIRMAIAIFEKLKLRMIAGDEPPEQKQVARNVCPKCGSVGYRYNGNCPKCDDIVSKPMEKPNGKAKDTDNEGT